MIFCIKKLYQIPRIDFSVFGGVDEYFITTNPYSLFETSLKDNN